MPDQLNTLPLAAEPEAPAHPPQYHAMVLLVDDQAMVCEAVRRALSNQSDIDFHYCADAREALALANPLSVRMASATLVALADADPGRLDRPPKPTPLI